MAARFRPFLSPIEIQGDKSFMALHFTRAEYEARIVAARKAMESAGLDGLLMFQQESMYYLTGFDTFGFCFFQCLYLGADGKLALLTRAPDLS